MKKFLLLFLLGGILISSCKHKSKDQDKKGGRQLNEVQVEGFKVQVSSITDNIEVPGSLLPAEETQIRAEVSGRVVYLNIAEGNQVKKGTLMVKLFDQDLQAQLKKLEVQLKIADKTAERQHDLLAINGISQQDYDLSILSVDNLKADIQTIKIAISKTEIRAPYDGELGLRNISLGAYISPADIITTLRQINILKLEFSIPEKYSATLAKGDLVNFTVEPSQRSHTAKITATENNIDAATRTLRIRALVEERHPDLIPGVFAKVNLQLGKTDSALMVPSQAIIPLARVKQVITFSRDSIKFITVETGIRNASYVQILNGISKGDTILISGLMAIRPDTKVKLSKVTIPSSPSKEL